MLRGFDEGQGRRVPPLGRSAPIHADDPHYDTGPCRRRGALIFLPVRSLSD